MHKLLGQVTEMRLERANFFGESGQLVEGARRLMETKFSEGGGKGSPGSEGGVGLGRGSGRRTSGDSRWWRRVVRLCTDPP
jgi:hypothetical protein